MRKSCIVAGHFGFLQLTSYVTRSCAVLESDSEIRADNASFILPESEAAELAGECPWAHVKARLFSRNATEREQAQLHCFPETGQFPDGIAVFYSGYDKIANCPHLADAVGSNQAAVAQVLATAAHTTTLPETSIAKDMALANRRFKEKMKHLPEDERGKKPCQEDTAMAEASQAFAMHASDSGVSRVVWSIVDCHDYTMGAVQSKSVFCKWELPALPTNVEVVVLATERQYLQELDALELAPQYFGELTRKYNWTFNPTAVKSRCESGTIGDIPEALRMTRRYRPQFS